MDGKKINILMVGPDITAKGGVSSVIGNYLSFKGWLNSNITFLPTFTDGGTVKKILFFLKSLLKLRKIIKTADIDIAHIHIAERGSFFRKYVVAMQLHKNNVGVILHHHGAEFHDFYMSSGGIAKKMARRLFEAAHMNIVLGQDLKDELLQKAPGAEVSILHNAVFTYPVNMYRQDSFVIMFLGHLSERKGISDFINVIKRLDAVIDKKYVFALCGEDVGNAAGMIDKHGIADRICHLGWIDKDKKNDLFSKTALHVLPSYNECLPMSILETMSYGIPNISTSIASIPEVVFDGVNGYLIKPGDTDALYDRILRILGDAEVRATFSANCFSLINEKFSLLSSMKFVESLYGKVYGEMIRGGQNDRN